MKLSGNLRHWRRAMHPGIRLQLTLWYAVAFALLLLIAGTWFYFRLETSLASSFDDELHLHTTTIASGISTDGTIITVQDVTGELPDLDPTPTPGPEPTATPADTATATATDTPTATDANAATATPQGASPAVAQQQVSFGTLVRVLNAHGKVVYDTRGFRRLVGTSGSVAMALNGTQRYDTVVSRSGQRVRLFTLPILDDNDKVYAVLQVGESLTPLTATLQRVTLELLLALPVLLASVGLGCYWLAGRALAPIDRLSRAVEQVEAHALRQRVAVPRSEDEVRRLALTFNDMIDRLDRAFARQRRFVADASHELRTPVAAIRSMTEVALTQERTPSQHAQVLGEVNAEAVRLSALIADLLAMTRADEGQVTLEHGAVWLDLLANDVAATVEPLASERGVTLQVEVEQSVLVMGDEPRLIQALLNLLDNAINYTDRGGRITLRVTQQGEFAQVEVEDTGIGIAATDLPHIFERLYRADPARSRATGGNGLGLSIVEWVAQAHSGTIHAQSQCGVGSVFTLRLPLHVPQHGPPDNQPRPPAPPSESNQAQ